MTKAEIRKAIAKAIKTKDGRRLKLVFSYNRIGKIVPHKKWTKKDAKAARAKYLRLERAKKVQEEQEDKRKKAMWRRIAKKQKQQYAQ